MCLKPRARLVWLRTDTTCVLSGPAWSDYVDDETSARIAAAGAGSTIPLALDADVRAPTHTQTRGMHLAWRLVRSSAALGDI